MKHRAENITTADQKVARTIMLLWMMLRSTAFQHHQDHPPPTVYWHDTLNTFVRWNGYVVEILK